MYWRSFLRSLPLYDIALFSKELNVNESYAYGARYAVVMRQFFVPEIHRPISLSNREMERFGCDVAFAGHFERDGRAECIRSLATAGLRTRLYADWSWQNVKMPPPTENFQMHGRVRGDEYAKALAGAGMCLCFLSKMNRDECTTRCFEIPACGRLLLSERTQALMSLFREDKEAVFFSTPDELTTKALWLRDHRVERERIAKAGMRRVIDDGHAVTDRMMQFLGLVRELSAKRNRALAPGSVLSSEPGGRHFDDGPPTCAHLPGQRKLLSGNGFRAEI